MHWCQRKRRCVQRICALQKIEEVGTASSLHAYSCTCSNAYHGTEWRQTALIREPTELNWAAIRMTAEQEVSGAQVVVVKPPRHMGGHDLSMT